jgi:hypothetical protein
MNIYARSAVRPAEQPWKLLHRWVGFEKKVCGLDDRAAPHSSAVSWAFPSSNRRSKKLAHRSPAIVAMVDTRPIVSELDGGGATGLN